MAFRFYFSVAAIVSVAATTGAGVFASISLAGQGFAAALQENLYSAGVQCIQTMLLLAPVFAVALVCTLVEKQARTRCVLLIFASAMAALFLFYFQGYQAAERAALKQMWTAE